MDQLSSLLNTTQILTRPIIDLFRDAVVITDIEGTILEVNQAYQNITGYQRDELIGQRTAKVQSGHHSQLFYQTMWDTLLREGFWEGEIWDRRKNAEVYPKWLKIQAITDDTSHHSHYVGVFYETGKLNPNFEERERLANIDPLTGLYNRRCYRESLSRHLSLHANTHEIIQLYIDIDRFKQINERYGYVAGDDLLTAFAQRLNKAWYSCGQAFNIDTDCERLIARFGGDEFLLAICFPKGQDIELSQLLIRISSILNEPFSIGGHTLHVSASIGMSHFGVDATTEEELIVHAEAAMYVAKHSGGDGSIMFNHSIQEQINRRNTIQRSIFNAIENHEFELYYQPKVGGISRKACGYEALVRWNHPELGLLPPIEFISIAEENGAILALGDWILEQACRYAKQMHGMGFENLPVAVNVSASQLADPNWVDRVIMTIEEVGLPKHLIELELTESQLLNDVENSTDIITYLRSTGIKIALDDFGTGYSSLSYLRDLPLDILKIDKSFVSHIQESSSDYDLAILKAISSLAKQLGMHLVAEGVEQSEQEQVLAEIGCDQLQGYLYSRPVPAEEFLKLCLEGLAERVRNRSSEKG